MSNPRKVVKVPIIPRIPMNNDTTDDYIKFVHTKAALGYGYGCIRLRI
ncbi:hypothetical protein [Segatella sp.]